MAEPPAPARPGTDPSTAPGGETAGGAAAYPGAPRWVKALGIAALVLALLVGAAMVASGGAHGPGRHLPPGGPAATHRP